MAVAVDSPQGLPTELLKDLHVKYILGLEKVILLLPFEPLYIIISFLNSVGIQARDGFEFWVTEHLRVAGVYWGLCAMHILGREEEMNAVDIIAYVQSCQHSSGDVELQCSNIE